MWVAARREAATTATKDEIRCRRVAWCFTRTGPALQHQRSSLAALREHHRPSEIVSNTWDGPAPRSVCQAPVPVARRAPR